MCVCVAPATAYGTNLLGPNPKQALVVWHWPGCGMYVWIQIMKGRHIEMDGWKQSGGLLYPWVDGWMDDGWVVGRMVRWSLHDWVGGPV